MAYVIKVKYGETLRRFTFGSTKLGGEDLSYPVLKNKIRRLFDISAEKQISLTYKDEDNDMITMADDQDLMDAVITQSLNPLRLHVTPIELRRTLRMDKISATLDALEPTGYAPATPKARYGQPKGGMETNEIPFRLYMEGLIGKRAYEGLIQKGAREELPTRRPATSPSQLSELMQTFLSQVPIAVKCWEVNSRKVEDANVDFHGSF